MAHGIVQFSDDRDDERSGSLMTRTSFIRGSEVNFFKT